MKKSGIALVMVVAVIAALLIIATPFAVSMRLQEKASHGFAEGVRARLAAQAARNYAIYELFGSHEDSERRAAGGQSSAVFPEDVDGWEEFRPEFEDLRGVTTMKARDSKGTIVTVRVEDAQGKINLNTAPARVLGNLLGSTVLTEAIEEEDEVLPVQDTSDFYTDGDPDTIDGFLRIDNELIAYRDTRPDAFLGCDRGIFFSAHRKKNLLHRDGAIVQDGRGLKIYLYPLWGQPDHRYSPYPTVSAIREIANWPLANYMAALLMRRGLTMDRLAQFGIDAAQIEEAGLEWEELNPEEEDEEELTDEEKKKKAEREKREKEAEKLLKKAGIDPDLAKEAGGGTRILLRLARQLRRQGAKKGQLEKFVGGVKKRLEAAKARREAQAEYEEEYYPKAFEALARLRREAPDLGTIGAVELETKLRPYLTVHSWRPSDWSPAQPVTHRIEYRPNGTRTRFQVRSTQNYYRGALLRVEGAGEAEYRHIEWVDHNNGFVYLFPQLDKNYDRGEARVRVAMPHPVNVNTASATVLEALLTGLRGQGVVYPEDAAAFVDALLASEEPLGDPGALRTLLQEAQQDGLSGGAARNIVKNAINPSEWTIQNAGPPFCYTSHDIYALEAAALVSNPAGGPVARHKFREVVRVAPPRELTWHIDSQADFAGRVRTRTRPDESQRERMSRVSLSFPTRTANLLRTFPDNLKHQAWVFPNPSHAEGTGKVQLETVEVPDRAVGAGPQTEVVQVRHFHEELDGHEVPAGGLRLNPVRTDSFLDQILGRIPGMQGGGGQGQGSGRVAPGAFEAWIKPHWTSGTHYIFDSGEAESMNRISLFYDGDTAELVLRVADSSLDLADSSALNQDPRAAEIRAAWTPTEDVWTHVACCWRGTKAGDLALFIDGMSVGQQRHFTRTTGELDEFTQQIPVEETGMFKRTQPNPRLRNNRIVPIEAVQIGEEVVEVLEVQGNSLVAVPNQASQGLQAPPNVTPPPPNRNPARGSAARPHDRGTIVQPWGYVNVAGQTMKVGGGRLVEPIPDFLSPPCTFIPTTQPVPKPREMRPEDQAIVGRTDTVIPAQSTDGFPSSGFILISKAEDRVYGTSSSLQYYDDDIQANEWHELVYYGAKTGNAFTNCVRGLATTWTGGDPSQKKHFYYGHDVITLCSIRLDDISEYDDGYQSGWNFQGRPNVQSRRFVQIEDEWFRYWKVPPQDRSRFPNVLLTCAYPTSVIAGADAVANNSGQFTFPHAEGQVTGPRAQQLFNAHMAACQGMTFPVERQPNHFHIGFTHGRAVKETLPASHRAGLEVIPTQQVVLPYTGMNDVVTVADAASPEKVEMTVHWVDPGDPSHIAFSEFLPREFSAGTRLTKFPNGFLPRNPQPVTVGVRTVGATQTEAMDPGFAPRNQPVGQPLDAEIDEIRLTKDDYHTDMVRRRFGSLIALVILGRQNAQIVKVLDDNGIGFAVYPGELAVPFPPTKTSAGLQDIRNYQNVQVQGFNLGQFHGQEIQQFFSVAGGRRVILMDEEVIGVAEGNNNSGRLVRGMLETQPAYHPTETRPYVLPFPRTTMATGGIAGARNQVLPADSTSGFLRRDGYLGIDAGGGSGIVEILPYAEARGSSFIRPTDIFGRGAFRGAFGTNAGTAIGEGTMLIQMPVRYHDRYQPGTDSPDAVYFETRTHRVDALWQTIEWDGTWAQEGQEMKVHVRFDGEPAWSADPVRPGDTFDPQKPQLFEFTDPDPPEGRPNLLGVQGDTIEVRVYFPFRPGAYARDRWKETHELQAIRVHYYQPVQVLVHERIQD